MLIHVKDFISISVGLWSTCANIIVRVRFVCSRQRRVLGAVLMASGPVSVPASAFEVAGALFRSCWEEAKRGSNADPRLLADAEGHLFASIEVALEVLESLPVVTGGAAVAMDVVPPVEEEVVTPPSARCGPDRVGLDCDPPSAGGEAWNSLLFVANLESEMLSLFHRHRDVAAAAYCRSSSAAVVWLFVDFEMFVSATGLNIVQAQALWDRWNLIVSVDRIYRGSKICVPLHELLRD